MLTFANEVRLDFNFNLTNQTSLITIVAKMISSSNFAEILEIITNLKKFGTATAIGMALRITLRQIKPTQRPGVPFNILLITDGQNNMFPGPIGEADKLKKDGSNIITLGIGTGVNVYVYLQMEFIQSIYFHLGMN